MKLVRSCSLDLRNFKSTPNPAPLQKSLMSTQHSNL